MLRNRVRACVSASKKSNNHYTVIPILYRVSLCCVFNGMNMQHKISIDQVKVIRVENKNFVLRNLEVYNRVQ